MADLFQTSRMNIVEHIKHIYAEDELDEASTCRNFRQVLDLYATSVDYDPTGGFSAYTFIPQSLPSPSPPLRESRARMWARALSSPMPLSALKGRLSCLAVSSSPYLRLPRLRLTLTLRRCRWYGAISGSWYLTCQITKEYKNGNCR